MFRQIRSVLNQITAQIRKKNREIVKIYEKEVEIILMLRIHTYSLILPFCEEKVLRE